ncbi:hypothetical protein SO802_011487 [Lithocarpus litseifolius]|uniref:non-specific serine/threonine protein kinase n=1 Tax=Lithocarpus litseifolius TaxID=425828 RepID=A0AAW2D0R6_9ROSI
MEFPASTLCASDWYSNCSTNMFSCGEITNVGYPFWGAARPEACGNPQLKLTCKKNDTTIEISDVWYRVLEMNTRTKTLTIAREDSVNGICSPNFVNSSILESKVLDNTTLLQNLTLVYGCREDELPVKYYQRFTCPKYGLGYLVLADEGLNPCTDSVRLLIPSDSITDVNNLSQVEQTIKAGYDVKWNDSEACSACTRSNGVCGFDRTSNGPTCYCPNQSYGSKTCRSSPPPPPRVLPVPSLATQPPQSQLENVSTSVINLTLLGALPSTKIASPPAAQPPQSKVERAVTLVFSSIAQPPQSKLENAPTPVPPPTAQPPRSHLENPSTPVPSSIAQPPRSHLENPSTPVPGPAAQPPRSQLENASTPGSKRNLTVKVAIGISAGVAGIILISIVAFYYFKREWLSCGQWSCGRKTRNEQKVEAFIRNYGSLAPNQYSYSFVKKVTNSFKNKIGQGGYGVVYKGMLPDGRLVAVKVLSESKGNGEDFINEIASISRTSHVNVVTLLGFCYEKKKRALIYEYMSNGSLDKFTYTRGLSSENGLLEWKTRNEIVVGIARGLEYLHRGCNTRILHFDIKPHNILLDDNLCPKISDFGLAKLCERKDSVVSTMNARGTAGYIAPEVHCRNIGRVSHKSDVYSYGMMVLEIVAGRKNIDVEVSHTSEIYFPHYVYEHLEGGKDLRLDGITNEEEEEIARKMILISLWCIQTIPSNRPSMTKVVEMLEGSLQSLPMPPNPSLSSPNRSP